MMCCRPVDTRIEFSFANLAPHIFRLLTHSHLQAYARYGRLCDVEFNLWKVNSSVLLLHSFIFRLIWVCVRAAERIIKHTNSLLEKLNFSKWSWSSGKCWSGSANHNCGCLEVGWEIALTDLLHTLNIFKRSGHMCLSNDYINVDFFGLRTSSRKGKQHRLFSQIANRWRCTHYKEKGSFIHSDYTVQQWKWPRYDTTHIWFIVSNLTRKSHLKKYWTGRWCGRGWFFLFSQTRSYLAFFTVI